MRRVLIILLTIGVLFTSGCTNSNEITNSTKSGIDTNNLQPTSQVNSASDQIDANNANEGSVDNSCFFESNISQMDYTGKFLFDDIVEQDVKLNISELANLKNGKLYELKLDSIEGVPNERLSLGYFMYRMI